MLCEPTGTVISKYLLSRECGIMHGMYHVCMQTVAYLMTSELTGNCTTNCDFQLQLAHSQLQLQLPEKLIN